jgi:hypothetical protein
MRRFRAISTSERERPFLVEPEYTTPADFTVQRNAVHVVVPQSSTSARFDGPGPAGGPPS